jgi:hypothetical protein
VSSRVSINLYSGYLSGWFSFEGSGRVSKPITSDPCQKSKSKA